MNKEETSAQYSANAFFDVIVQLEQNLRKILLKYGLSQ